MSRKDLTREQLYESVKSLIECDDKHLHLCQQKLYTLYSIAFQYLLYKSSKDHGCYIIRVEDSFLAEKLARKSKDPTTRKFMARLLHTRKLRYENSTFYLDYFNFQSWALTSDLPQSKIKAALVVKNTSSTPMADYENYETDADLAEQEEEKKPILPLPLQEFGKHFYLKTLMEVVPETLTVAFGENFEGTVPMKFGFIPEPDEVTSGVRIASDVILSDDE